MWLMRLALLVSFGLLVMMPGSGNAGGVMPAACPFHDKQQVTVDGVARSVKSGAQEAGESINTYFYLETSNGDCGARRIMVFAHGIIPCIEGDKVAVRGMYYRPSEPPFDFAMIDMATVSCRPAK